MLPKPFEQFIPSFFTRDEKLTAFADKMDDIMDGLSDDTLGLNSLTDPVKIPYSLLDELGYLVSAGIKALDTETQKRIKIATAVQGHKLRGTFAYDAKPKIDAIAGGDSRVFRAVESDDEIVTGDGLTPAGYYWSTVGVDGIDDDLGIVVTGSGEEIVIPGNIYIDVDNDSLSTAEVDQIVEELRYDVAPAYMRVYLGYIDTGGSFVVYSNGTIN